MRRKARYCWRGIPDEVTIEGGAGAGVVAKGADTEAAATASVNAATHRQELDRVRGAGTRLADTLRFDRKKRAQEELDRVQSLERHWQAG